MSFFKFQDSSISFMFYLITFLNILKQIYNEKFS